MLGGGSLAQRSVPAKNGSNYRESERINTNKLELEQIKYNQINSGLKTFKTIESYHTISLIDLICKDNFFSKSSTLTT